MDELLIEQRGAARWLTLHRPERRNALSRALVRALHNALVTAANDERCRCIVLAGAGPVFCAGADLNEFREVDDPALLASDGEMLARTLEALSVSPKPVIARVQGAALGGGVGLVAAVDFAIAVPEARFTLSEVRLGLTPAVISPYVVRALGRRRTQAFMLASTPLDAPQALAQGLLTAIVESERLDEAIDALVLNLTQAAPGALADVKTLLRDIDGLPLAEAREVTVRALGERRSSAEGQEGMSAFLEKRKPAWSSAI
jgi:methylglutaconyl-CoA hydratase